MSALEQRPRFYEHQYLEAADLDAVVGYSRAQAARHLLGGHRWGISLGLELREVPGPNTTLDVFVQPGYAWDGFGRPIVVPEPARLGGALFAAIDAQFTPNDPPQLVDVWLEYQETQTKGPRPGFEECDEGPAFARVVESFRIEVGRSGSLISRPDPIEVAGRSMDATQALLTFDPSAPELADGSVPHQSFPPDGGGARWPVPIGVIAWQPGTPGTFVARDQAALGLDRRSRQYCGVVAGSIEANGGHVRVHDRTAAYSPTSTSELLWVEGDLRVDGVTRLYGHRLEFVRSLTESPRLPFHVIRRDGATGIKLQAAIGEDSAGANRFAVGRQTAPDVEAEDFVVTDNGRVGIGTSEPKALLHLKEDGLEIGTSANPDDNFFIQSNTDGPRGLRIYNGDVGAGTHLASFTRTGRLGIGTTDPSNVVHVNGNLGIRQNRQYLSGGEQEWSSLSYNAHHSEDGQSWVFPDPSMPAVTIEMDTVNSGPPRFEVYSTLPGATTSWRSRLKVFGDTGDIGMAAFGGNVGIGTYSPTAKLDVQGEIAFAQGLRPVGAATGLRVVWGRVNSNGTPAAGDGFTVARLDQGRYEITFTTPFPTPPSVVVTQVWKSFAGTDGTNVVPYGNAIVDQILVGSTLVGTGLADDLLPGASPDVLTDSNFSFLVIGQR
jgi:hypothetical protein